MRTIYRVMDALEDALDVLDYLESEGSTVCRCRDDYECRVCRAKKVLRDATKIRERGGVEEKRPRKDIVCMTTGKLFTSLVEAGEHYKVSPANIGKCCKGQLKSAGKWCGRKLEWKYYDELTVAELIKIAD